MTLPTGAFGALFAALVAFIITWLVSFLWRLLNAPVSLFNEQKDRADLLQQENDRLKTSSIPKPVFIADIIIAAGVTPQTTNPVLLIGKAALNNIRLRIVVKHSHYVVGMGWSGWADPRQVELADMKDVIAGQQISVPVVSCLSPTDNSTTLMWGAADGPPVNAIKNGTTYRAQIRVIAADGNEQQPIHFLLIRTTSDERPYLVNVTKETDFSFISEWQ